jgi:hypothetical protein
MKQNGWFSRYILIWTYERGTLQYDIICILILAFIFFIPPSFFNKRHYQTTQPLIPSTDDQKAMDASVDSDGQTIVIEEIDESAVDAQ